MAGRDERAARQRREARAAGGRADRRRARRHVDDAAAAAAASGGARRARRTTCRSTARSAQTRRRRHRRADSAGLVGLVERGEALGLDRVEVGAHVGEERRELGRADRADRQRLEIQQLRVRRVLPREDQVAERDGQARRAVEPAVAHDLEEVLRRRRVGDGHAQLDDVLGVRAVQAHAERLVVQDPLAVDVLDDHVEDLGVVVDLGLELEVGRDDDLDVEQAARHGADVRGELDARDLVHEAVERLAHLRELHELRQVARLQVVVPVPRDLLLLELPRDRLRHPPELPEGALRRPEPPLDHLAQRQGLVRRRRPAALERHLEERAAEPRGRWRTNVMSATSAKPSRPRFEM